jgi:mannonate dehydratase
MSRQQETRREVGRMALGGTLSAKLLANVRPQRLGIKLGSVAPVNPTDDDLLFFKQLGVDCVSCAVTPELNSVEGLLRIRKRYADAGLLVHNIRNLAVTNNQT